MDVPLREHLDHRIAELDRRYTDRFAAADRALQTAEQSLREYKAGSNEWRDALKDANNRMATRDELEKLAVDVRGLQKSQAYVMGMAAGVSSVVSLLVWALAQLWQQ